MDSLMLEASPSSPVADYPRVVSGLTRRLVWLFLARSFDEVAQGLRHAAAIVLPEEHVTSAVPEGPAAIASRLSALRNKLPQNLLIASESYEVTPLGPSSYAVSARCQIGGFGHGEQPRPESPSLEILCSLAWTCEERSGPTIGLCHCSVWPLTPARTASNSSFETTGAKSPLQPGPVRLQVRDAEGTTYWLVPENIVFVRAAHQYADIQCTDRRIRVHAPFGSVVNQLQGVVVQVHRSYAVNPRHVSRLEGRTLFLATGASVPVPQRSLGKVQTLLSEHLSPTRGMEQGTG